MRKNRSTIVGVLALIVVLGVMALPSVAQTEPIVVELLTERAEFTDDVSMSIRLKLADREGQTRPAKNTKLSVNDASHTVVAKITVQPGAHFPWHTHPGPVIVNVAEGELVYVNARDCVDRGYQAGEAFVDPGKGNVHTAFNPSDDVTVLLVTFFEVPETGPLTITEGVKPPPSCNRTVGAHHH